MSSAVAIREASSSSDYDEIHKLFNEYADWLDYELCYENVRKELAALPGDYGPPDGRLLIAYVDGEAAGCGALRKWGDEETCEMKRLYVRPRFRGLGIGKKLAEAIIAAAREIGYRRMRLDTIPDRMTPAIALYRSLGFTEIDKYRASPTDDALYMELIL